MKEEFDDVFVDVEFDSDSDIVTTLQLPDNTMDDDCVSLSDFDMDEDEQEEVLKKKEKPKKQRRKRKFPKMSTMKFTRKLSLSRGGGGSPAAATTPVTTAVTVVAPRSPPPEPKMRRSASGDLPVEPLPSPSSKKRLLTMMKTPKTGKAGDQPNNKFKREKKAAFQLGVILGAFCLCFMPYFLR